MKVSAVVVFNPLENSSFCFTNVIIVARCLRTCPKINYMSVLKFSFVLNTETWSKFVVSKKTCTFMLLGNNLFIVFLTDLKTCSPFPVPYGITRRCFCHHVFQLMFSYWFARLHFCLKHYYLALYLSV